jgi:hypothetical protein
LRRSVQGFPVRRCGSSPRSGGEGRCPWRVIVSEYWFALSGKPLPVEPRLDSLNGLGLVFRHPSARKAQDDVSRRLEFPRLTLSPAGFGTPFSKVSFGVMKLIVRASVAVSMSIDEVISIFSFVLLLPVMKRKS